MKQIYQGIQRRKFLSISFGLLIAALIPTLASKNTDKTSAASSKQEFSKKAFPSQLESIATLMMMPTYEIDAVDGQTINTCEGIFYDSGGPSGDYVDDENYAVTFCADNGGQISLELVSFEVEPTNSFCGGCCDYMTIHDGTDAGGSVLTSPNAVCGSASPQTYTSTNGCLYFVWSSDFSLTGEGWTFNISCSSPPPSGDADYSVDGLDGQTTNTCTGIFADSGDTEVAYGNNENFSTTFCSDNDNQISFTFEHFNLASGDTLDIFDGEDTAAASLGSFSGVGAAYSPGVVTSSGTCMTFEFTSDDSGTAPGWEASINCTGTPDVSASTGTWDGYTGGNCGNSTTIAGTVFEDIDNDGTRDARDAPIIGVNVSLYDDNGQVGSSTTTDASGQYSFSGLSDQVYRVEFSIPDNLTEGPYGSGSGTAVQFVKPGVCADLGLVDVVHYCDTNNPLFIIPCYVNGDPQDDSNSGQTGIAKFDYSDSGDSPTATYENYVTAGAVGTVWGAAYDADEEKVYLGAFLKRHAGLGPQGIGAIYMHTNGAANTSAPLFYDFGAIAGTVASNASRFPGSGDSFGEEGPCGTCDNIDPTTFGQVGKAGFGDLEINPENTHLYATNLYDRKVYTIALDNPTANSATPLPGMPWLDNTVCTNGIARPWALEFRRGKLYVGVICDASLGSCTPGAPCSDLTAEIYSFDGTSWTNELSQSLDYYRQAYVTGSNYFVPWIDNWSTMAPYISGVTDASFAQPIVMDIEFDDDHSIIIGIGDRTSMQLGYQAPPPPGPSGSTAERNLVFGDILRAAYDNSTGNYTMENNGVVGGLTTTNPNGSSGIGGRSFYWGDYWTGIGANRFQGGIGSLATLPGSGQVMTALADAIDYYSNGVAWMNSTNGANVKRLEVYQGSPNGLEPNFAKSAGVGDIELLCSRPGIEIGNIVWWDDNLNGRQDPSEPGIGGVTIELWIDPNGSAQGNQELDGSAVKVAETTTDALGRYIFSYDGNPNSPNVESWLVGDRVLSDTFYQIRIPDWQNDAGLIARRDALGYTSHLLSPTQNQGASGGERDNNAYDNPGNAASAVRTGRPGENDHSHDFSFGGTGGCDAPTVIPGSNTPCEGEDLELTLMVSGGQAPYSYNWSGPNSFISTDQNPIISNIDATLGVGTYSVTVTDALECTEEVSIVVAINSLTLSASSVDATCGSSDGSIDLTIDGNEPYTIDWSDDALDGTEDPTNLGGGSYSVTVTDADGCSASTVVAINSTDAPTLSAMQVDETCGDGNGSITVSITDGASASISWSGNAPTPSNTPTSTTITGLSAGTYSVTVTNTVGMQDCSAFLSVVIENSPGPSLSFSQINETCGDANASIDLTVSGGTPPYTFDWSDNSLDGTEDPNGLAAGTYDLTVSDANSCQVTEQIMISNAAAPTLATSAMDETCGSSNGAIDLTVSGGAAPFTYAWSNGLTTEDITMLGAGTYTVTVTDMNGCTVQTTETIDAIAIPTLSVSTTNASDCNSTDGMVDLTVSGGTASFSYNWSNGATTEDLNSVDAGTYTVTITDANTCTATITAVVGNDTDPVLSVVVTDPMGCGETGSVDLTVTGGLAPYTFDWSNDGLGEIDDTEDISGLSSGIYTVIVIGADGCSAQANVSIREIREPVVTPSFTMPNCGMSDGSISVAISDPDGEEFSGDTYTYEWSDIGIGPAMRVGLAAGNYGLTVSNGINCSTVSTFSLNDDDAPSISPSITSPTCGDNNGSISLSVTGGTPSYSYQWSKDGMIIIGATASTLPSQSNGVYGVTVTDMAGCMATASMELSSPLPPLINAMASPTSCDSDDGTIDLLISGVAPFQVDWEHIGGMDNPEDLTGLGEGDYNVTVTDANGCQSSEMVTIAIFGTPVVSLNDPADRCIEDTDMSFSATPAPAMGTTGEFTSTAPAGFTDDGDGTADLDISTAGPGTYDVTYTYTDENGCMDSETVSVTIYGLDYGDLPSQYAVTFSENGGRHCVPPTPTIYMGSVPDTETDGTEDDDAGEIAGGDGADEDGLTKPNMLFRGEEAAFEIAVVTSTTVHLYGFVDWNNDGAFNGPGEVEHTTASSSGPVSLTFDVPQNAAVGMDLGARFRIGSIEDEVDQATGLASDGEIEDYLVQVKGLDFGDLPDDDIADTPDYHTDYEDNGPRHGLPPTPLVFFGEGVEQDDDGQPTTDAAGDDEEDDITLPTMLFRGENATFSMNVTNNSDSTAKVVAYIDWNGDGDFDEDGEMASSEPIPAMSSNAPIDIALAVPLTAVVDSLVGARFRISTDTAAIMNSANGFAMDGEVEDYLVTIKDLDFGDLPDDDIADTPDYHTDYEDNGPRHGLPPTPLVFFGEGVEQDDDGQPTTDADGDDEEDDITLPTMLFRGENATFSINVTNNSDSTAKVVAYIDWNGDGDFDEDGEMASSEPIPAMSSNAPLDITLAVPLTAVVDSLVGARFRISTDTAAIMNSANGFAMDGEVEDYLVTIKDLDFGDLPDADIANTPDYHTDYENNGPRHGLPPTPLVFFGEGVEQDDDGQPTTDADGDDEEDDITLPAMLFRGENATFSMNVTNNSDSTAKVVAYIDWNGDGDFDEDGEMASSEPIPAMSSNAPLDITLAVPLTAVVDSLVGARFRISTDTAAIMNSADGFAMDGEVEDYLVSIKGVDYGDAPDPDYPTLAASDGASHGVPSTPVVFLGSTVDIEEDGQPHGTANGDDNNEDDEDGVIFEDLEGNSGMIIACETTTIVVTASTVGYLNAWLDYNGNGSWADDGEQIFTDEALVVGQNEISFTSPCDIASSTERFLRFRFDSAGGLSPTGFAMDGEVEDYTSLVKGLDFGDLPDPDYPTLYANDPARHVIPNIPNLYLGEGVDEEAEGQQSAMADGDGFDDGIQLVSPMIPGSSACLEVSTQVPDGITAYFHAWIDFNSDGSLLDEGDQIISNETFTPANNGSPTILCFDVPSTATFEGGMAFLRARFGPEQDLEPTGISMGGEVEDHKFLLAKVGNLVWQDNNYDGIQGDASTEAGLNGIEVLLTWAGPDGDIGLIDDNETYSTTTANVGDKDGIYYFCGLIDGNYSIAVNTNRFPTLLGEGTPNTDNDDEDGTAFTINLANLPIEEDGTSDMPGMINGFPDNQDNQSFDFGYAGLDFGDLPDGFGTTAGTGPIHAMNPEIFLGSCVDGELDGTPDDDAGLGGTGGDDGSPGVVSFPEGVDCLGDEDGIQLLTSMIPGTEACIQVTSTMPTDEDGFLNAWIDFNGNGSFDEGEQLVFTKVNGSDISPTVEGPIPMGASQTTTLCYIVPEDATFEGLETHLRFRLSPDGGLGPNGVYEDGSYPLGEVEDYYQPLAEVGNYAWLDVDEDGIQDPNEPPLAGVEVRIYRCDDDVKGDQEGEVLITDEEGFYQFIGLLPGEYCLAFAADAIYDPFTGLPYTISPSGTGSDDAEDSNPDETGCTGSILLDPLESDPTVDVGIIVDACYPPFSLATAECHEHGATISWKSINGDEEEGLNYHCWKLAIAGAGPQHAVFGEVGEILDLLGAGIHASIIELSICEGDPGVTIMETDDPQVGMITYELSHDLLQPGTAYWFAVAEVCNDAPDLGNNSPWNFQRFFPITLLDEGVFPGTEEETEYAWDDYEGYFKTKDYPFEIAVSGQMPTCPSYTDAYTLDGCIIVEIADGASCPGTYDIYLDDALQSTGVVAGDGPFSFCGYGVGDYTIRVELTNECFPLERTQTMEFTLEEGIDDTPPEVILSDYFAGTLIADNLEVTQAEQVVDLGQMILPEGACSMKSYFVFTGTDNCDNIICTGEAVTANVIDGDESVDPGTQIQLYHLDGEVVTDQGVITSEGCEWIVEINWSVGHSTVEICMDDSEVVGASSAACVQLSATVEDSHTPQILAAPVDATIPVCADDVDVIYGVSVIDQCDQYIAVENVKLQGVDHELLSANDGYFEYLLHFDSPGSGSFTIAYEDPQGNTQDLQVAYQVNQAAEETAPQIIAQGNTFTALPCEDGAEVIFTVHVIDDCDAITEQISISGVGADQLTASPTETVDTRGYVSFSGVLPADEYTFIVSYPGAADVPVTIIVEQEDNRPALIDLPGNTTFTIPSCDTQVNATWSVQVSDDCDEAIDLERLCIQVGGSGCLSWVSDEVTVLSNENGAALIELQQVLNAGDNGSILTVSYVDEAGATSEASQTITVNATAGQDNIPPVIVYPTEAIQRSLDPCGPNTAEIKFSVSANDNCNGWVPVELTAPGSLEASAVAEGNAQKWTITYAAREEPYAIALLATDAAGNTSSQTVWVSVTQAQAAAWSLSCNTNLSALVDEACQYRVTKDIALEGDFGCLTEEDVVIRVNGGEEDIAEGIGEHTFTVYIKGNVYCHGTINLYDNIPPSIECPVTSIDLICTDIDQILGSLEYTGSPVVGDNCSASWYWSEEVLYGEDETCDISQVKRIFTATDAAGLTASCEQYISIRKPTLAEVLAPAALMELNCDDIINYDDNGYPIPDKTGGTPYVETYFGSQYIDPLFCNLAATYTDSDRVDFCDNGYKFTRTWKVLDWCDAPNTLTFTQLIKVGDFVAPTIMAPEVDYDWDGAPDLLQFSTGPFDCTAAFEIPLPVVTDNCSNHFSIDIEVLANGEQLVAEIKDGEDRFISDIPLGCHAFRYVVRDDCGNSARLIVPFTVKDLVEPTAICDDELQVSVESNGLARVFATDIDEGSWDNCSDVMVQVRRLYTTDSNCEAVEENFSMWGDFVDFSCCDIGQAVRIELRVWDDANGDGIYGNTISQLNCHGESVVNADNSNVCWLEVVVEDKLDAFCIAPHAQTISCDALPYDFDPSDIELLEDLFGEATAGDNCPGINIVENTPTITLDDCGTGTILRSFSAQSPNGGHSNNSCQQLITISEVHNYEIRFPADSEADCGEPSPDTLLFNEIGCDLLALSATDEFFSASGDECYKILRTYRVINWCEYDGDSAPVIVGRDEDCDGQPGDEAIWVLRRPDGMVYFDRNNDETDNSPVAYTKRRDCDGLVNPGGYWIDNVIDQDATRDPITGQVDNGTTNGDIRQIDSRGYWQYTQVIKVYDSVDPVIEVAAFETFEALDDVDCTGEVAISFTIEDVCTEEESLIIAALDLFITDDDQDGNITQAEFEADADVSDLLEEEDGVYVYEEDLPVGEHALLLKGSDGCGNETAKLIFFSVVDRKGPAPVCIAGLAIELMPTEPGTDADGDGDEDLAAAAIWANDFVASPVYDCHGQGPGTNYDGNLLVTRYSIHLLGEEAHPDSTGLILTCDSEETTLVEIHAWDELGNHDYCETFILVQDLMNRCEADAGSIAGIISTEAGEGVQDVEVQLSGPLTEQMTTENDGLYRFEDLPVDDYSVTPHLDQGHLNGVTTFDLILITRHILGTTTLNSPYQLIAADVNNSRSITTLDVIEARRLILGITEAFANNTSWRFIDKDHTFPDLDNPWSTEIPELRSVNNLAQEVEADFLGVKIADVNGSAIPNSLGQLEERTTGEFALQMDDMELKAGQLYQIPIRADQLAFVTGYQGTLSFAGEVEVVDIHYGLVQSENLNLERLAEGLLPMSWNGNATSDTRLFTLVLKAKADGTLSDVVQLSSRITMAEAYNRSGELLEVVLDFGAGKKQSLGFELYQNQPNPFHKRTWIAFHLPEASVVDITIYDGSGKVIRRMTDEFDRGRQGIWLNQQNLPASGILFYRVTAGQHTATRKMIVE